MSDKNKVLATFNSYTETDTKRLAKSLDMANFCWDLMFDSRLWNRDNESAKDYRKRILQLMEEYNIVPEELTY